jgi:hypothetical protein
MGFLLIALAEPELVVMGVQEPQALAAAAAPAARVVQAGVALPLDLFLLSPVTPSVWKFSSPPSRVAPVVPGAAGGKGTGGNGGVGGAGTGGNGGDITIVNKVNITTSGAGSHGIFASRISHKFKVRKHPDHRHWL